MVIMSNLNYGYSDAIERVAREPLLSLASLIVTGIEWSDEL
jgi:hypothetical protein